MEQEYFILISTIIGATIGYITNTLAICMLFHPKKSFLGIQGVIPKRKTKLAENISENIHIILPKQYAKIKEIPFLGEGIDYTLKNSIKKTILETSPEDLEKTIKNVVRSELKTIEILGGLLGGIIGLIQGIILLSL